MIFGRCIIIKTREKIRQMCIFSFEFRYFRYMILQRGLALQLLCYVLLMRALKYFISCGSSAAFTTHSAKSREVWSFASCLVSAVIGPWFY